MAVTEAFADEPKRYNHKLECLQKAADLLPMPRFFEPDLARQRHQDIQRLRAELELYSAAMRPDRLGSRPTVTVRQQIIIESDLPDYVLSIAQQKASSYYQEKYRLTKEAKVAQHNLKPPPSIRTGDIRYPQRVPGCMCSDCGGSHQRLAYHDTVRPEDQPIA